MTKNFDSGGRIQDIPVTLLVTLLTFTLISTIQYMYAPFIYYYCTERNFL